MKCVICRQGETISGFTTVTLERDSLTLVVKNVPAQVCPNCGEAYLDEEVTDGLLKDAEAVAAAGALVDVRQYASPRRRFTPAAVNAPDSTTLLREDRDR
jgi:YgiT-type zinc finger domain-containing protein